MPQRGERHRGNHRCRHAERGKRPGAPRRRRDDAGRADGFRFVRSREHQPRIAHVAQPLLRILDQTLRQERPNVSRRRRWQRTQIDLARHHVGECFGDGLGAEQSLAGQHLVEHDAERPDVGALVDRLPLGLLGTHVRRGAEDHPRLRHRGGRDGRRVHRLGARRGSGGERFGETEIQHLHRAVRAHLDVGGLQIAMDDPLLVRGFERFGNLPGDRQHLVERHSGLPRRSAWSTEAGDAL